MSETYRDFRELLSQVRRRWRTLVALRATTLATASAAVVVAAGLVAWWGVQPDGLALVALVVPTLVVAAAALAWGLRPLAASPGDAQIARYVEERCPELEDSLVTAVATDTAPQLHESPLFASMLRDASARLRTVELDRIVDRDVLRKAAVAAALAALAFVAVMIPFSRPVMQAGAVTALYLFPSRVSLQVTPGDVRVRAGDRLTITAHLPGDTAGLVPAIEVVRGDRRQSAPMARAAHGFAYGTGELQQSFAYRVKAGAALSREYRVTVLHAPRVARIDLHYDYPPAFGLRPRVEEDSGDVYGPAGTRVRLVVATDKPVTSAALTLGDGKSVPLAPAADGHVEGELTITEDGSYRVALADADGLKSAGDTEYFIRTLDDRPPDVRVLKPAGDRQVTPVEEVVIEARADDDYGIASFDLVYSVRGAAEKVVPLRGQRSTLTASGAHTLYLEELGVQPGDFVTYYARARDVSRGKRSSEARSDIFFLEVKPFEEEFVAAQSQAMSGGGGATPIDDLAQTQKEIIVATWKLDRRSRPAGGQSEQDIRSIARAQGELKKRAQDAAGQLAMAAGDQQRRRRRRGGTPAPTAPEENDGSLMARAVEAMGAAQGQLDRLSTSGALPHEMTALNELLKAQAEIRRRQVQRQQAQGGGRFQNRQQQDLSTMFDRELRRQQATNYEQPNSTETQDQSDRDEALDKLRGLARRQSQLNDQQRALAAQQDKMELEEMKRQLERLTRDQSELRRQAEELAQQMARQRDQQGQQQNPGSQPSSKQQAGGQPSPGQPSGGPQGGSPQQGQHNARSLRDASEEMGGAASDLRRQDPEQAAARGARALEKLRQMEQQLRGSRPDDRRRALGDLQLESRQLADAQRQLAEQGRGAAGQGPQHDDTARRLAAEQERLAGRADRLRDQVRQLANGAARAPGKDAGASGDEAKQARQARDALADAARQLEREKLAERMRESARTLRQRGQQAQQRQPGQPPTPGAAARGAEAQQAIARALDKIADQLASAAGQDGESRRLSEQLARARELREKMADVDRKLNELARSGRPGEAGQPQGNEGQPQGQPSPTGREGPQGQGGQQGSGAGGRAGDVQRLQGELADRMRETRELVDQMRRDGGLQTGRDAEGLHPGLSAPGTEAFKQDFAKWESLKKSLALALEQVETSAAAKLRSNDARDKLHAGGSDAVPDAYRALVDRYYRALAERRKPK